MGWFSRLIGSVAPTERTAGAPTSSNGASSFHLGWNLDGRFSAVSVDLEVLEPPTVPRLYFWALQADFADGGTGRRVGGAHLGLQWHPQYPGSGAVNWGGYQDGGGELRGSTSSLPSALGNVNTRNLRWSPGTRYRLTIARVGAAGSVDGSAAQLPDGYVAWRGSVADTATGDQVAVRDLYVPGDQIVGVAMWSEVFARCDDPSVLVRWSQPTARTADGVEVAAPSVRVNYQAIIDGGCTNTDSSVDGAGYLQRTATARSTPQGAVLSVADPRM